MLTTRKLRKIMNMSDNKDLKKLTPFDKGIKLVSKPNDFDEYDDDPDVLRAELSCGHVTDPLSLTACCKAQLNDGQFKCLVCKKELPYDEVRKLAKLTIEEQKSFEEQLGMNTLKKIGDFKDCPGCGTLIERSDESNLCVECSVCTEENGKPFEFCWECLGEWKGSQYRTDQCGNKGCTNDEKLLKDCPMITIREELSESVQCPNLRKCPYCGMLIEHNTRGCNKMKCPECDKEFCFICLKPGHDYDDNPCTVAARQINTVS